MAVVGGRYHLIKRIASGGMAEVWLAEHRRHGGFTRRVVVKTIHEHLAENEDLVTAFADEARLAGLLRHPHIVRVEDFGEHDGRPYLVMEYLDGHDLKHISTLANGHDLIMPERLIVQIGLQMAQALHYAHQLTDEVGESLRVVHRDVSPQNIMLSPNGTAKLVDFGIARASSNIGVTETGTLKGKLAYLSPEQASGKKAQIDHRTDQFALGVVLWELLSGSRLFASDSDVGTLKRVAFGDIPSLALFGERYPQPLIRTIDKALRRERGERFENCGEFAKALRVCLSEMGGAFSDTDYRAWMARLNAGLSTPKPLPILPEDAVQRTQSVPAVQRVAEATQPRQQATLAPFRPATAPAPAPTPDDEATLIRPAIQAPNDEATQIVAALPDLPDPPTRVSVRMVKTASHASVLPVDVEPEPAPAGPLPGRILLALSIAALVGVAAFVVMGEARIAEQQAAAVPMPLPQHEPNQLRGDQLSREGFLEVVEANSEQIERCLAKHGAPKAEPLVELGIRSNGKPLSVRANTASKRLGDCIEKVVRSWRFPAFQGPSVTHRFRVKP